jgi:hypothetical protein
MLVATSRSLLFAALMVAALVLLSEAPIAAPATPPNTIPLTACSGDSVACGDLATNGTCCAPADQCCLVPEDAGDSYCVPPGGECRRYGGG